MSSNLDKPPNLEPPNLEPRTSNLESGTWNPEPGTWNLVPGSTQPSPQRVTLYGSVTCPNCHKEMRTLTLMGNYQREVIVDLCQPCQAFWFDGLESVLLAPASVLELFKVVGEVAGMRAPRYENARCPYCDLPLVKTFDQQRNTKFEYHRCPSEHGRLTSFFNFLREKDFIRPLSTAQLEELRRNLRAINCSNCGAPVDLTKRSACLHCGSPLSMLDLGQAQTLVTLLRDKAHLERAKREVTSAFGAFETDPEWYGRASNVGLVNAALNVLSRWLVNR